MDEGAIDDEACWAAVLRRDRGADGRFVTGVLSTGIYCRPSCAARHPRRANVRFFADGAAARGAGLRACLRCRPDDVAADEAGIARALTLIEMREEPPALAEMAAVAGYSPHHFHRLFRRATGVTPAAYARGVRAQRMEAALARAPDVTSAIYAAGYQAPARFYAEADRRLGMVPTAWRDGGRGAVIRWARAETQRGPLLVAATDRGVCRIAFAEGPDDLARRFPNARIEPGEAALGPVVARALAAIAGGKAGAAVAPEAGDAAFREAIRAEIGRTF